MFQCDDGLLPSHPRTATCVNVSGIGQWVPNPANLLCEEGNFTHAKIIAICIDMHAEWPIQSHIYLSHNSPRK